MDGRIHQTTSLERMLQQLLQQHAQISEQFYVLFLFNQPDYTKNYEQQFQRHIEQQTVIYLEEEDIFQHAQGFIIHATAYEQQRDMYVALRQQARQRIVEKLAKSVIFYVMSQKEHSQQQVLHNRELLHDSVKQTTRILQKVTFLNDEATWDTFYTWYRAQITRHIFEELIVLYGIQSLQQKDALQFEALFLEVLTQKVADQQHFLPMITQYIDDYIQLWLQQIIDLLREDLQMYIEIDYLTTEPKQVDTSRDIAKMTTVPNYMFVMNNVVYQALREVLYKNKFFLEHDVLTSHFVKGNTKGYVQFKSIDGQQALVPQLSSIDIDVLDILCAIFLHQAKHPQDVAKFKIQDVLQMRGLKTKLGGEGRRGGYEAKQKAQVTAALQHIQNIWLTIDKTTLYKNNEPMQMGIQGRAFLFTNRHGEHCDFTSIHATDSVYFCVDEVLAKYLVGTQRQLALLPLQALRYHAHHHHIEKQLCRYLSWRWRTQAYQGNFLQANKVHTLIEMLGMSLNERAPSRTRERFEKAFDQLLDDGLIAEWHYMNWDEAQASGKHWLNYWLNAAIVIEPPNSVKETYRSIEKKQKSSYTATGVIEQLTKLRKAHGLTLLQLAEQLDVSAAHLSTIERQQAKPSAKLRARIAKWLEHVTND